MKRATVKQEKVLEYIKNHIETIGYPPSVRDISSWFNISPRTAWNYLNVLEDKGLITVSRNISRGIKVL